MLISANSRNLEVSTAIACHETFRHQITEIIWDDANIDEGPLTDRGMDDDVHLECDNDDYYDLDDGAEEIGEESRWYRRGFRYSVEDLNSSLGSSDVYGPAQREREMQSASNITYKGSMGALSGTNTAAVSGSDF